MKQRFKFLPFVVCHVIKLRIDCRWNDTHTYTLYETLPIYNIKRIHFIICFFTMQFPIQCNQFRTDFVFHECHLTFQYNNYIDLRNHWCIPRQNEIQLTRVRRFGNPSIWINEYEISLTYLLLLAGFTYLYKQKIPWPLFSASNKPYYVMYWSNRIMCQSFVNVENRVGVWYYKMWLRCLEDLPAM